MKTDFFYEEQLKKKTDFFDKQKKKKKKKLLCLSFIVVGVIGSQVWVRVEKSGLIRGPQSPYCLLVMYRKRERDIRDWIKIWIWGKA